MREHWSDLNIHNENAGTWGKLMQFDKGFLHLLIAKTLLDLGEEDTAISFLKRAVLADSTIITLLINQTQNDCISRI